MNATVDRPRSKSLNPLRSLVPFIRPYRGMMLAALGALLMATVAMLALPVPVEVEKRMDRRGHRDEDDRESVPGVRSV